MPLLPSANGNPFNVDPFAGASAPYQYDANSLFNLGPVSTSAGDMSYDDYMRSFYGDSGTNPANLVPQTPGGNDWKLPSINLGSSTLGNYAPANWQSVFNYGSPANSTPTGSANGKPAAGQQTPGQQNPFLANQKSWNDFGMPGWNSQNGTSFDPWAGNPYAGAMANQLYQGFLQNGQVAGQTSDAIWQTMQQQMGSNFMYESARAQTSLAMDKIANEKAAVDGQLALAQSQLDAQSKQFADQLKLQSDQLANQMKQYEGQLAFLNAQLASQDALGNKQLDAQTAQANAQLQAMLTQMQQQFDLGSRQLDIQDKSATSAADQLAFQQWLAQQQLNQQSADRTQKSDLFNLIAGLMGGTGGLGGGSGGLGGGGAGGGSGSIGFQAPGGQYAGINVNTGITAGGLNPGAIRQGVSAIEGSGAANYAGSGPGVTAQQKQALGQDLGALNLAGGQMAATDALRTLLPQNAQLSLNADRAKQGASMDYASFVAEQERRAKGEQLGQQGNLYNLILSMMA